MDETQVIGLRASIVGFISLVDEIDAKFDLGGAETAIGIGKNFCVV
jgi:hypothetical protein